MNGILNDKKNIIILILAILAIAFGTLYFLQKYGKLSPTVIVVGNQPITERDIFDALKNTNGNRVIMRLIDNIVLEEHARSLGITVSTQDVDQLALLMKHTLELQGTTVEEMLRETGMSKEHWRNELRNQAIRLRLVFTADDVKKAIAEGLTNQTPYSMPEITKVRVFSFSDERMAENALHTLRDDPSPDAYSKIISMTNNSEQAKQVILFTPGIEGTELLTEATKNMAAPSYSDVIAMQGGGYIIIQIIERTEPFYVDINNGFMIAAYALMEKDQKAFDNKIAAIQDTANTKINIDVVGSRYVELKELYRQRKLQNPDLKGIAQ